MKRLKEQQEKMEEINAERRRLFALLEKAKADYKKKNSELDQQANRVAEIHNYDFHEAIQLICYLVSLVEEKEYVYREKELPIIEYVSGNAQEDYGWCYISKPYYDHPNFSHKIKLQYICCDEEAAEDEICAVIGEAHAMGVSIYNSKPLPLFYKMLTQPAKNYVQINIHNSHSAFFESMNGILTFFDNDDFTKHLPITLINYDSKICDPKFMYIVDFMNYLTVMKLKEEDFTLTMDEMMAYARDFAEQVKKEKSGEEKILRKTVVEV